MCFSCASPAIVVRCKVFRADAGAFVKILIQIQSMCSMFSHVTQVSVCRHQMASCKQSSLSERYNALTLPDCNMGKNLRVRAIPAGCDAASILCHKHDSGRVGLWFVTVRIFWGDLLLTADVQKMTRTCQSPKKDGKLEPVHVLAHSDTQAHCYDSTRLHYLCRYIGLPRFFSPRSHHRSPVRYDLATYFRCFCTISISEPHILRYLVLGELRSISP